jgi:hypothetical protein
MGAPFSQANKDSVEQALRLARAARRRAESVPDIGGRRHKILANGALEDGAPLSARISHARQQLAEGSPLHPQIAQALALANDTPRPTYARGGGLVAATMGQGLPMSGGNGLAGVRLQPVLPAMQHAYLHHLLRQRPHFEVGGDADRGYGGSDNSNEGDGGYGGWGGGYSGYGSGLSGVGIGPGAGDGGFGIGGLGGGVGQVASGLGNSSSNGSDWGGGGWSSMSVGNDNATTMGRNIGSVASLGNTSTNTGYSYSHNSQGNDDGGYAGYSGGDIGPSGIATGAGYGLGKYSGMGDTGIAGFGNFGSTALGDAGYSGEHGFAPYGGGLNSSDAYGYGIGNGSFTGYSSLDSAVDGNLGKFALGTAGPSFNTSGFGIGAGGDTTSTPGFGGFQMSQNPGFASGAVTGDEAPTSSADATNPYGTLGGVYAAPFSGPAVSSSPSSLANVAQAAFGPSRLGMFGSFSNNTDQNAQNTVGAAGLNGVPSFARVC